LLINLIVDDTTNADCGEAFFAGWVHAFNFAKTTNATSRCRTTHHAIVAIAYTASQTKDTHGSTTSQWAYWRNDGNYVNTCAVDKLLRGVRVHVAQDSDLNINRFVVIRRSGTFNLLIVYGPRFDV
jgi:hypothetical protein